MVGRRRKYKPITPRHFSPCSLCEYFLNFNFIFQFIFSGYTKLELIQLKMLTIKLTRSGGQLGKKLHSSHQIDMDEQLLVKKLKSLAPEKIPLERDGIYHSLTINGKKTYPIDLGKLKGDLKKIVGRMEDDLKVQED